MATNASVEQYLVSSPDYLARRDELILQHLPQVTIIARRIHSRLPPHFNLDDLISTGVVGLLEAVDRYDPSMRIQLNTYAEHRIRGAILDSLRTSDWAPREVRKKARQIESAIHNAKQRLSREPSDEEIAAELAIGIDEYHEWLTSVHGLELQPLESVSDGSQNGGWLRVLSEDEERSPARILERSELERMLTLAIDRMPKMERTILTLYYFEELTLSQVSRIVNLHISRVGELRIQGVLRLRSHLDRVWKSIKQ